jgi:ABC-type glycerol-3-phosphate transport system substrate-binding protein
MYIALEEAMDKRIALPVLATFIAVFFSAAVFVNGGGKDMEAAPEETDEGPSGYTIQVWGEPLAPGITDFLRETAAIYQKRHPEVRWEIKHIEIDSVYKNFYSEPGSDSVPDLQVAWGGVFGLEQAWAGRLLPLGEYVSEDVFEKIYPVVRAQGYWDGEQWLMPLFIDPWMFGMNRVVWEKAGLDPDNPPATWDDFVSALQLIKEAGFVPWCFGGKYGLYGSRFQDALQYQYYDSAADYQRAVTGDESLTDKKHAAWWGLLEELRDRGLFNTDAADLSLAEGQDLFFSGNAGVFFDTYSTISAALLEMGDDVVDVTIAPVPGTGAFRGGLPVSSVCFGIPAGSPNPAEAGQFLELLLSGERQNALYEATGAFPPTDNVRNSALVRHRLDKKVYGMIVENASMTCSANHPSELEEALYGITEEFFTAGLDASRAAERFENAAQQWRESYPAGVENFRIWAQ